MSLTQQPFGTMPDGRRVDLFTLSAAGITFKLTNYGGRFVELHLPDRKGTTANVTLGFDSLDKYLGKNPYFGAAIGRVANRIARGTFRLEGKEYHVPVNNGVNSLHGGTVGFDRVLWDAEHAAGPEGESVVLTYKSRDGEQGYPGEVTATLTYTLETNGTLQIEYEAKADRTTVVNLTHHPYFNLAGAGQGTILGHWLTIDADAYTPVDESLIPTGEIKPVKGTPFDFVKRQPIGERIDQVRGGYDHNYCLREGMKIRRAALLEHEESGRSMEIWTDYPGLQFYSGNFLDGSDVGNGGAYPLHGALCLETQFYPDAVNQPGFPSIVLAADQGYGRVTRYRFGAK